jgi:hypothetical protein
MNGKFILLAMLCINVVLVAFAGVTTIDEDISIQNNLLYKMYDMGDPEDLSTSGQPTFTSGLSEAVASILTPISGGIVTQQGVQSFIDVIRLVLSFFSLITPLPILAFIYTLGASWIFNLMIMLPIILLYFVSIAEFFRGGSF